jgi:carbon starvation protein CstA
MSISKIVTAAVAAVILTPAVYAATNPAPTPAAQCESLQKEYETAATANATNPNAAKAKKAAEEAAKLCKEGKPADGVKKYEHALKELGVKAK